MRISRSILPSLLVALLLGACDSAVNTPVDEPLVKTPADFPALPVPAENKLTAERIALGKKLFFDAQLSRTGEVSCGSCHLQENAFADPRQFSIGIEGRVGTRNAPSLANMAYNTSYFWDGGVPTLEQQIIAPIINPLEMDMTMEEVVRRVSADPIYVEMFRSAYDAAPSPATVTRAVAAFIRTMVSGNSRYDRYQRGDKSALDMREQHGMKLFFGEEGECFHCHVGFNLTNNSFQNNGLYREFDDPGRFLVTEDSNDIGKFKVPTLRNIALTAPYMHDGSLPTLESVVEHYASGGKGHPNTDPTIRPLPLTEQDKADIVAFLKSMTDEEFVREPRFKP